ncbi:GMC family oxidoreductase [Sphingopyxis sp. R3-92]|uniref:GMC family oxidoreductase n=1 Tax=Sphingopyxis sp. R3-92 TaxID=3158553 RepID=UPI003EE674A5
MDADYVIVGGGAAGCVLANRLSKDPGVSVVLFEAGPADRSPLLRVPKGFAKLLGGTHLVWPYMTTPEEANAGVPERWVRGRVLGGSTSINGMMYVRGQPADFDELASLSSDAWNWREFARAYAAIEAHPLGANEARGGDGPLRLSLPGRSDPLFEAFGQAGRAMGWTWKEDVNAPDDIEGIGFAPCMVDGGVRVSAATAFLRPAMARPNLTVMTNCTVDRIVIVDGRAQAVEYLKDGQRATLAARRDIILCAGALATPGILERSGIGDARRLDALGIEPRHINANVGENLLEHRALAMQWRLAADVSDNKRYHGWRLGRALVAYLTRRRGPLAEAVYEQVAWFRSRPDAPRPDVQIFPAAYSLDPDGNRENVEKLPGMHIGVFPLRPTSAGSVHIGSTDPEELPVIQSNYGDTAEDRRVMVDAVRTIRDFVAQAPLARLISQETIPGTDVVSDEAILDAFRRQGTCGYHAVGSCRMGRDPCTSVVDPDLKVHGLDGLRIADTSVFPVIPAGNTAAPTMAMAWLAAERIGGVS